MPVGQGSIGQQGGLVVAASKVVTVVLARKAQIGVSDAQCQVQAVDHIE